jgi:hypothetical protein
MAKVTTASLLKLVKDKRKIVAMRRYNPTGRMCRALFAPIFKGDKVHPRWMVTYLPKRCKVVEHVRLEHGDVVRCGDICTGTGSRYYQVAQNAPARVNLDRLDSTTVLSMIFAKDLGTPILECKDLHKFVKLVKANEPCNPNRKRGKTSKKLKVHYVTENDVAKAKECLWYNEIATCGVCREKGVLTTMNPAEVTCYHCLQSLKHKKNK